MSAPKPVTFIDLCIEQPQWQSEVENIKPLLQSCLHSVWKTLADRPHLLISVLLTNDEKMQSLNQTYRQKPTPTNVLSFCAADFPGAPLGDIALGFETCKRETAERGISLADHLCHLFVHGVLHLYGYDHQQAHSARIMEALETQILKHAGQRDPWQSEPIS